MGDGVTKEVDETLVAEVVRTYVLTIEVDFLTSLRELLD